MNFRKLFRDVLILLFCFLFFGCGEKKKAMSGFVTRWTASISFKYDLGCFVGILTGRELYKKYHGDLYAEWHPKLTPPVAAAVKKIDEIIGPNLPPGPRLCLLLSAVAAEDSLAAILRAMDDDQAVCRRLMASDFASEKTWQQYHSLKPFLRIVFEFLQKEKFEAYWHNKFYPNIVVKLPRLQQELQSYDVIGDLGRFLVDWEAGDTIEVFVLRLLQPHAVRLTPQRYLTDVSYPMHLTVKSAYHELLHPYCERLVDSVLAKQFESLKADPFLQQIISRAEPASGYKNFMTYCSENVVIAAELWVAEQRRVISLSSGAEAMNSSRVARNYLERHEGGIHVLAAVIHSYLETGLKLNRMTYANFIKDLFASGRLQPGKIEMRYREYMRREMSASG